MSKKIVKDIKNSRRGCLEKLARQFEFRRVGEGLKVVVDGCGL